MRFAAGLLALLVAAGPALAWPGSTRKAPERLFVATQTHPDVGLELALKFLATIPVKDHAYYQFFWFGDLAPEYRLAEAGNLAVVLNWKICLNTVSSSSKLAAPFPVDPDGLVWAVNIVDLRWTRGAVLAVARRDTRLREPWLDHFLCEKLRRAIGVEQDPATFHCDGMVPGAWFLREILEVEGRSESYYDLLYANERFPDKHGHASPTSSDNPVSVPAFPYEVEALSNLNVGGSQGETIAVVAKGVRLTVLAAGTIGGIEGVQVQTSTGVVGWARANQTKRLPPVVAVPREKPAAAHVKAVANFPATVDDFKKKWGAADVEAFAAREKLFLRVGEVILGSKDDPKTGSPVAYQNRVAEFLGLPNKPGAVAMSTRDFFKTAGKGNLANFPKEVAQGDIEEDLSEHLFTLPNGFQASLLAGSAKAGRKRAEFGDPRAVRSSLDPHYGTIVTQYSCIVCHAPKYGVIAPSNRRVSGAIARGVNLLAKYPDDRHDIEAFFIGWEPGLEVWRSPLRLSLQTASRSKTRPTGWTGQEWADQVLDFVLWYDAPVTLDLASAELGAPRLAVMLACLVEGSIDAGNLFLGEGVPRTAWDIDLYPRLALILAAARLGESGDPFVDQFLGELLRQALGDYSK